jgi:hypothetical protein
MMMQKRRSMDQMTANDPALFADSAVATLLRAAAAMATIT